MALGPGSIAFVGFNADGDDNFAFVVLEDIAAGQVIRFIDDAWNGSAFGGTESELAWTAPAGGVVAGTVVVINSADNNPAATASIGAVSGTGPSFGYSATAETLYAITGTRAVPSAFLAAVSNDNFTVSGLAGTGLTAGVNAVGFAGSPDGVEFTGARSGLASFADFLAVINNTANWAVQPSDGTLLLPLDGTSFAITAAAPALQSIAPVTAAQAEGDSGAVNFDFTVTLTTPAVADTVVSLTLTGDASDFATVPASVTVLAGQSSAVATYVVSSDTTFESDENFTVTASLNGVDQQAVATITNDDAPPANVTTIDLSTYVRVGRYDLPEPTRTSAPTNNLLAQEASGVTYNWDTDTLFIVGDGGQSITQVSKTGQLIDAMTMALGSSPQGTEFYDPEGVTYIGNGEFVFTEERDRQLVKFTYVADATLNRADTQVVDLGTFVGNTGLEGLSYDPLTGGFVVVKEISPEGIFQTNADFALGTATNGSSSTVNSIDLFNPAQTGLSDFADVFALSNLAFLNGQTQFSNLLVLSQADGRIVNIDRAGNISSSLHILGDLGNPLSVPDQQHEGLTMDSDGNIYVVSENGGGDIEHPQLWVYAKSVVSNQAPSAVTLNNSITSILENSTTSTRVKVADIVITDDGIGTNNLTVAGTDSNFFEIFNSGLYIKAGTVLDFETKTSYSVAVNVDDATLGSAPDATVAYNLSVTDVVNETPVVPTMFISEVHPSGSGNGTYSADWFEVTNAGSSAVNITGWQMDDNSNGSGKVALRGVTSIDAGKSAIFIEGTTDPSNDAALIANFSTAWFGSAILPAGVVVGVYGGSGVGLGTGGDAVNLLDGAGNRVTGVSFGSATTGVSFDNFAGLGSTVLPLPTVSSLSTLGTHGTFRSANNTETGSPGTTGKLLITEVAPWSSGNSPVNADWFELTNFGATTIDLTGWKMDDSSQSPAGAVALSGVTSIASGESVIFIETSNPSTVSTFLSTWFGANPPAGLKIGTYSGSGVGLSTGGDAVNIYDNNNVLQASVNFGASDSVAPLSTFDNAAGLNNATISQLSAVGVNGALLAAADTNELGSPGQAAIQALPPITKIHTVQGSGAASTMIGQVVTIEAIVVGDFQNSDGDTKRNIGGFYLQEENADADGNAATSEGIFVFTGNATDVHVGDRVRVTGTVAEFSGSTQLSSVTAVTLVEAGAVADVQATMATSVDLPAANVIQRSGTTANSTTSFYADLEAYEGMLVTFTDKMTISEQFSLDQFVEVRLVAGDNPVTFTQENQPDVAGSIANLQEIAGRTIVYDDGLNVQNTAIGNLDGFGPTYFSANALRMGDTVDGLTGVLDYAFNQFRVRSVEDGDNVFTHANPREEAPADVGGTLKVGSFNVLNYFKTLNTINEGSGADQPGDNTVLGLDPRGANSVEEFNRQTEKLVNVISTLNADVLGLIELENDFQPGSSGNAIEYLVNALNTELGAGTYAWVNPGQQFVGGDAIAVGFIYKPGVVEVSFNTTIATLDDSDLAGLGLSDLLSQSSIGHIFNGLNTSRVPLAVTFTELATGGEFTAVANHFKSKSGTGTGADADQLDGQGNWQQQRELAAEALKQWIATDPTGSGDSDVILLGDFNAYLKEDVIDDILKPAGYANLAELLPEDDRYSYIFDGQRSSLDHILASTSAASQVTGVTEWHINADEADALDYNLDFSRDPAIFDAATLARVSDHDPLLIGLDLVEEPAFVLQLLHLADGEAGLLAAQTASNLAALVDAFDDDYGNTLILAGGDNFLPGPFLAAGTDASVKAVLNEVSGSMISLAAGVNAPIAAVDIAIHNEIGVEVSSIGNHEFDLGSRVFRDSFTSNSVAGWVGANFVHVSANLDFSGDPDLNARFTNTVGNGTTPTALASTLKGRIAPATVVEKGGEKIGIVGATTQILEQISSPSGTEVKGFPTGPGPNGEVDNMTLLAAQLQPIIDELISEGINKIILQAHLQQIGNEMLLASKLRGVDIILSAGSNTRLGDADDEAVSFPGHAANFAGNYPLQVTDADGKTTLIVNTDNEYTYLGRLVIEFDENGDIIVDSIADNQAINGAYASTLENVAEAWGTTVDNLETTAFAEGTKGEEVRDLTDAVQGVINAKDGVVFGYTNVYLEGERIFVRNQETNLGNITADANAAAARDALGDVPYIFSLKNGGGIRAQIGTISPPDPNDGTVDKLPPPANPSAGKPEGGVSQLDIENSLRFDNRLMVFDATPEGLLRILNWGAGLSANNGGFPQIGGVKFSFDPTKPGNVGTTPSSRVVNVSLINEAGELIAKVVENGVVLQTAPALISVVALNFTANGGDGYPVKTMVDAGGNFLATNFRYLLDDGTLSAPIDRSKDFTAAVNLPTNTLGEQKAFSNYLDERYGTPDQAFDIADTPASQDLRIENLSVRSDAVFANEAPETAGDLAATVDEGQAVVITTADLTENDVDNSGEFLVYHVTSETNGQVLLDGVEADTFTQADLDAGKVSFLHDGTETTAADFTVTLSDPGGPSSDPATVVLTVNQVNDAPVANGDSASTTVGHKVNLDLLGNDSDLDGDLLSALIQTGPSKGILTQKADGTFDYTAFASGPDSFTYVANDGAGNSNLAMVTINVGVGADTFSFASSSANTTKLASGAISHIVAGSGNDTIGSSNPGGSVLNGGAGNDVIVGGSGADMLIGGEGNDRLSGKGSVDTFVFQQSGFGHDTITDFKVGEDILDLRGLGFESVLDVLNTFTDNGPNAVIHAGADDITLYYVNKQTLLAHTADILV